MATIHRIHKLRKMPPGEIAGRVMGIVRRRQERRLYGLGRADRGANRRSVFGTLEHSDKAFLDAVDVCVPGCRRGELARLDREFPRVYEAFAGRSRRRAEAVLSGSWPLLGQAVDLRGQIDWHRDPKTGFQWPRVFYADVSTRPPTPSGPPSQGGRDLSLRRNDGEPVDVKYVWELGRQQYVVELARGWLFTGNEQFACRARGLMLDWIAENPLYEGIHWTSPLEVAMRCVSWMWAVATLQSWNGWQPGDWGRIADSLAEHGSFLEGHLEFYSSPYNHLIGEATALYLVGLVFGRSAGARGEAPPLNGGLTLATVPREEAERWRKLGRKVLSEHGPRQFYEDGFCVEQAVGYHFYTIGFLSLAVAAARTEGDPLMELEPVLHRAFVAGSSFRQPDGRWPAIGDVDSARSIPVHHDDFWDFNSLCSLGAVLFDDASLKLSDEPGEELFWLLECRGIEHWQRLQSRCPDSRPTVLGDSGYAIASEGGDWLLLDAGPIADGLHPDATSSTAHGHADVLQVLYWHEGLPVLVDPGMPFYFGDSDWVRHFRSQEAHNTLEIDGVSPVRDAGGLSWSHAAERPVLDTNLSDDVWLARAKMMLDPPGNLWGPDVVVERFVLGLPGIGLWIADWIELDRPRGVRWHWQLPAGTFSKSHDERGRSCAVRQGNGMVFTMHSNGPALRIHLDEPQAAFPTAWQATGYGTWRPAQRLRCETEGDDRVLMVSFLGVKPIPTAVRLGDRQLMFHGAEPELMDVFQPDGFGEICWSLRLRDSLLSIAAGGDLRADQNGWDPLRGVGNWSAARRMRRMNSNGSDRLSATAVSVGTQG